MYIRDLDNDGKGELISLLKEIMKSRERRRMVKIDITFKELGFHRLEAHINLDNIAFQKTAEAAGMEFECIRKGFIFESDAWTDNMIYAINNTNNYNY